MIEVTVFVLNYYLQDLSESDSFHYKSFKVLPRIIIESVVVQLINFNNYYVD